MELNGALSNPFVSRKRRPGPKELHALYLKLLTRHDSGERPIEKRIPPRRVIPVTKTITEVLSFTNEPMRVADIHKTCEQLLGKKVSYRSVKTSVSKMRLDGKLIRLEHGVYGLRA